VAPPLPSSATICGRAAIIRTHAAGRRLILGGKGFTIVGVMPKQFTSSPVDLWMPAQFGAGLLRNREARFLGGVGRLKSGVTIAQAQEDLVRVQRELGHEFPQTDRGWSALVGDLKEARVGSYRQALVFVFGAVAWLLVLAVANIAGLVLTELHQRERELAIRSSLGGTRTQVIGGVMREVLLIVAAGVALGCTLAQWLVDILAIVFTSLPHSATPQIDARALAFAALSGVLAILLCGLLPVLQATRANLATILSHGGRGSSGAHRWQSALVCGQIALGLVLLASAGLMLRSYYNLSHVNLGFDPAHTVTFHVGAAWDEDRKRVGQMQTDLLAALDRIPGVESAGFTNFLPATGATLRYQVTLEGLAPTAETRPITVGERSIRRGYLRALGTPLLAGQDCPSLAAVAQGPGKALVSRRFADVYGAGLNLLGRHLRWATGGMPGDSMEIVGIVGNSREDTLDVAAAPYLYVCVVPGGWPDPEYLVRTRGDTRTLLQSVAPIAHNIDSTRAVFGAQKLENILDASLEQPRLNTGMLTVFALAALLLASVGLYELVSLAVAARTREIGVRMALGAGAGQIVRHVASGVGRLLATGIGAGFLLTLLADRLLRTVLFGVSPMDPMTLLGAGLTLSVVSAFATLAPARRAARIHPLEAIRSE
jgi:putative ABC transport system permease protein